MIVAGDAFTLLFSFETLGAQPLSCLCWRACDVHTLPSSLGCVCVFFCVCVGCSLVCLVACWLNTPFFFFIATTMYSKELADSKKKKRRKRGKEGERKSWTKQKNLDFTFPIWKLSDTRACEQGAMGRRKRDDKNKAWAPPNLHRAKQAVFRLIGDGSDKEGASQNKKA